MFSQKNENGFWRELEDGALEQVCGGHDNPKGYDSVNEGDPLDGSATEDFEMEGSDIISVSTR
jgi:hypothetical protein